MIVAGADAASLRGIDGAELLLWVGLCVIFFPSAVRQVVGHPSREERIGLVVLLGLTLYIFKVLHSPFAFTYNDEILHAYNASKVLQTGVLFSPNPILEVSPFYPGLVSVTAALASLSGLSVFEAGLVVVGVARFVFVLALYLFFEQVSRSSRAAGIAVFLYMTHSNFLYWSSQFAYESLALPLAAMVLFMAVRRSTPQSRTDRAGFTILALIGIGAVVMPHHLTSYMLALILLLWSFTYLNGHLLLLHGVRAPIQWLARRISGRQLLQTRAQPPVGLLRGLRSAHAAGHAWPGDLTLVTMTAALTWLLLVAMVTMKYLAGIFGRALFSIIRLIAREEAGRALFVSETGYVPPVWERLAGFSAVLLLLLGLPFGLWYIWRYRRSDGMVLLLAGASLLYFGMLGFRFTSAGWETSNRASAFLYVGLSFVIAFGIVASWPRRRGKRAAQLFFAVYLTIISIGSFIIGWPPLLRLSQPLVVSAGSQVFEPQGITMARWAHAVLGPGHRVAVDLSNALAMLNYADQITYSGLIYSVDALIRSPEIESWHLRALRDQRIRYIVVDRREMSWDNMRGLYFDRVKGNRIPDNELLDREAYTKFDQQAGMNRIFDSGNIVIYDTAALIGVGSNQAETQDQAAPEVSR
jgi:hypothetical protein